ncbi:MAG: isochorismatase family protein [Luteitalea sp.]|nr:isochorismatase family protein [Luteitalea sp.]
MTREESRAGAVTLVRSLRLSWIAAQQSFVRPQVRGETTLESVYGLHIPRALDEACDPQRLALIVYDMQVGILGQIKNGTEVTAKVVEVLHAARHAGVRVFFMRHMSLPNELMGVFQFRMAMAWQRVSRPADVKPWFLRDSPGFHLVPEVAPLPSEAVFDKITMSAFEGTPLDIALRDCGINAFVIVGVATEVGIEPTVRHGADLGYIPIVVTDACGAGHQEAGDRALASLRYTGDAILTDVAEISEALRGHAGRSRELSR